MRIYDFPENHNIPPQGEEYHGLTALHLAIAYGNDELAEVGSALLEIVTVCSNL